jgi:hypothetical protein
MYMMENKEIRQINIDPELLKVSNNGGGTKRKQSMSENSIRVRAPIKPRDHNKTTKRNALLKFIRRHQANNSQKWLEGGDALTNINAITSLPKNEIDETLEYLMSVADEVKKKEPQHLRNGKGLSASSLLTLKGALHPEEFGQGTTMNFVGGHQEKFMSNNQYTLRHDHKSSENVSMKFPDHTLTPEPSNIVLNHRHLVGEEHPKYGCLRSGELPTYRQLQKQQQQSHFPKGWSGHGAINNTNFVGNHRSMPQQNGLPLTFDGFQHPRTDLRPVNVAPLPTQGETFSSLSSLPDRNDYVFGEGGNVKHSAESTTKSSEKDPSNIQLKIMRQRRTSRRTFKIGKSKTRPKVGVLISNRTIRKNIATNALLLKQVPMTEIRRYLVKHNLITVGSNAPDYVLRKMYETTNTVCGEIFNHNNENLLHNFFHGKDEI